jgi:hypothetical protein
MAIAGDALITIKVALQHIDDVVSSGTPAARRRR